MKKAEPIRYIDRHSGEILTEKVPAETMLRWLYHSKYGKAALNSLVRRKAVTRIYGKLMTRSRSAKRIIPFCEAFGVDMNEAVRKPDEFKNFNEFFVRKLKPEARPIGTADLVSPADGKLLCFERLSEMKTFFTKGQPFDLQSFFKDKEVASRFIDGTMMIVRLAPVDYHRYHFPVNGKTAETICIKGWYNSVNPYAVRSNIRIFFENKRTYSIIETEQAGTIAYCEIAATMVGSIVQTYTPGTEVQKGDEKGFFKFGGSTVILFFEKGKVKLDPDLILNSQNGMETKVLMGENIGSFMAE